MSCDVPRRNTLFSLYATARVSGFVWTAAESLSQAQPSDSCLRLVACPDLYRIRLGRPFEGEQRDMGSYCRRIFERRIVAVSPDPTNDAPFPLASITAGQAPGQHFIDDIADL